MGEPDHPHADTRARAPESARTPTTGRAALSRFLVACEDIDLGMRELFCGSLDDCAEANPTAEAQVGGILVLDLYALMDELVADPGSGRLMDGLRAADPTAAAGEAGSFIPTTKRIRPAGLVAALVLGLERDGDPGVWAELVLDHLGAAAEVFGRGEPGPFGRHFRRAALTELALAGAFEPGGDRPDGPAARFVRTWQRLAWLGVRYRARRARGGLDESATLREVGALWRLAFNQPAAAAWPELAGALAERAEDLVGVGYPMCEVLIDLDYALPVVAAAHGERLGWPFPCRIAIDGPLVRALTITPTDLTDDRPAYAMAVATVRGDFAVEVEIDAHTGSATIELGHRDARFAMAPDECELAALARLGAAIWADMVEEGTHPGCRFDYVTRPPLETVQRGGLVLRPQRGQSRLAELAGA